MSADLFAEFNELYSKKPDTQAHPPTSIQGQSQDLFSSFQSNDSSLAPGRSPQWSSPLNQSVSLDTWGNSPSQVQSTVATSADDDDGWGDFEVAESSKPSVQPTECKGWQVPSHLSQGEPRAGIVRASTFDLMTNNLVDTGNGSGSKAQGDSTPSQSQPRSSVKTRQSPRDPSVLFDAEDFELQGASGDSEEEGGIDDDEFGDFETVASVQATAPTQKTSPPSIVQQKSLPSLDLLSLDDPTPPAIQQPAPKPTVASSSSQLGFGMTSMDKMQPPKSPSYQERNRFHDLAIKTPTATELRSDMKPRSPSPITAWPTLGNRTNAKDTNDGDDEDWGAWDDVSGNGAGEKEKAPTNTANEDWGWDAMDSEEPISMKEAETGPPPINVPPPSIILSAFPDLLNSGNALLRPIAGQTGSIKQRVLSDPKAAKFLQGYILLATTAAHVIAGRKQRWHRDKILAKSMSISAAGSKGMKLAGVDKTQAAREDREAADVVAVWRDQVGRLRSAVTAANSKGKVNMKVPELSENLHVQTAKVVPTAPKPCVICGLKRDERVSRVDIEVEDSFGEWWVDHWGHRACKNFWLEHEQRLRQR